AAGAASASVLGSAWGSLRVSAPREQLLLVELNRPEKRNALGAAFWREMVECFEAIARDSSTRAVVITGAGNTFTAGIDLGDLAREFLAVEAEDAARRAWQLRRKIEEFQETFSVLEKCPKPVIAAVNGACVGGGEGDRDSGAGGGSGGP
ncbi:ECH1 protein, partial [Piaya cayana]|nr:ECH1 protein [Piaya cayana]